MKYLLILICFMISTYAEYVSNITSNNTLINTTTPITATSSAIKNIPILTSVFSLFI